MIEPPPGMTSEQLEFFTYQTARAVAKAHDMALEADKRRARHRIVGFIVLFFAFLGNVAYSNHISAVSRNAVVRSGDIVAVSGCNRDYEDRVAVRGVLIESKHFTQQAVEAGRLTKSEAQLRLDFYNERLRDLPLPDCRHSDDVLTDDPDKPLVVPEARYPEDTEQIVPPVSDEGEKP